MSSKSTFRSDSSSEFEELVWVELLTLALLEDELMDVLDELADVEDELEIDGLGDDILLLTCGGWKLQLARVSVKNTNKDGVFFIYSFPQFIYYNKTLLLESYILLTK
jgi:hypothetical protein